MAHVSTLSGSFYVAHIIVIGAGVTGVTTAYELLNRGHTVTVVEKHRYPAMETSFANGGQLSASNAEVWNSWGTILKGIRYMLQADAPLLINPDQAGINIPGSRNFAGRSHTIAPIRSRRPALRSPRAKCSLRSPRPSRSIST